MRYMLMMLVLALAGLGFGGTYSGGSGTEGAPYQIATVADWKEIISTAADFNKYFILTQNIDFQNETGIGIIGISGSKFSGYFDGNGKTIKNFTVTTTPNNGECTAIFGFVDNGATITKLTVENVTVTGSDDGTAAASNSYTAILCGELTSGGTISYCTIQACTLTNTHTRSDTNAKALVGMVVASSHGSVSYCTVIGGTLTADSGAGGGSRIGGIVGYQTGTGTVYGSASHCTASVTISRSTTGAMSTPAYVGGICGEINGSNGINDIVTYCTFSGGINYIRSNSGAGASLRVGGIVGCITTGLCTYNIFTGDVSAGSSSNAGDVAVGGIAGYQTASNDSDISYCSSSGNISITTSKSTFVGGIVGMAFDTTSANSSFTGTLTIESSPGGGVGGICGYLRTGGAIDSCYANCALIIKSTGVYAGGAFGQVDNASVTNCYVVGAVTDGTDTALGITFFGGFIGYGASSTISDCFTAIGPWSSSTSFSNQGGFVGLNSSITANTNYWDETVSGVTGANTGATKHTTEWLKTKSNLSSDWDFDPSGGRKWKMLATYNVAACTYPYLDWQVYQYSGGAGTTGNPYQIRTLLDWNWAYTNVDNRTEATVYFKNLRDSTLATEYMIIKQGGSSRNTIMGGGSLMGGN